MHLEIITPDKKIFDNQVDKLTCPGEDGSFQVLNNHAPMIAALKAGNLVYEGKEEKGNIDITGGVVEVKKNKVIVLIESIKK